MWKKVLLIVIKPIACIVGLILAWLTARGILKPEKPSPPTIDTKPIGGDKDKAKQGQEILDGYED